MVRSLVSLRLLVVLAVVIMGGCARPRAELDLTTSDPAHDQQAIARYHRQEAARLRQAAQDLSDRVVVYEQLFGSSSDWVAGTKLLAQSYEAAAKDHDRKAGEHLNYMTHRSPSASPPPGSQ